MRLTGLQADNPIAWMAACGAARLLPGARLRWDGDIPELDYQGDPIAELAALPADRLDSPEVQFKPKLGGNMNDAAWQALKQLPGEWALAYGSQTETGMSATSLKIRPGDYDMVSDARGVLKALTRCAIRDKVIEALVGPWRYEDAGCVAWGWDAAARIDSAAIGSKVENAPKLGVLGAYWLGWEALPLFPTINGRTLGWSGGLRYPTWSEWLDYPDIRALLLGLDGLRAADRQALGVMIRFARYLQTHVSSGRLGWASVDPRTSSDGKRTGSSRHTQAPGFMIV
ncbi:MAG: hypothetical protein KA204_01980 [Chromatiaceae bacterium]|nr:hypothetical protein [Chromatiaceae bacterium]